MKRLNNNRGVALITVLFIIALTASITTAMLTRLASDLRRMDYNFLQGQIMHFQYGVESWALARLYQDNRKDANQGRMDYYGESWSKKIVQQIVDNQVNITALIVDQQAKFNLNNLAQSSAEKKKQQTKQTQLQLFKRLLQTLKIDDTNTAAILDWIDSDQDIRFPHGAEDSFYLSLTKPYRSANNRLVDISELALIKGITPQIINKLKNYITVLPQTTPINVNTASAQVINALSPDINLDHAKKLINIRRAKPFKSNAEFITTAKKLIKKTKLRPENLTQLISVASNYFLCHSSIIMSRGKTKYTSLIKRSPNKITIMHRSRGLF